VVYDLDLAFFLHVPQILWMTVRVAVGDNFRLPCVSEGDVGAVTCGQGSLGRKSKI
jgi:hypothetical protein